MVNAHHPGLDQAERTRLIEARRGKETVVIMGWAEKTRHLVPWDDLGVDVEVWGLNESYNDPSQFIRMDKITRWFQLHPEWDFRRPNNHNDPKHWEWLRSAPVPVLMQKRFDSIPTSVPYPLAEIVGCFPGIEETVCDFQSTAAYMAALAWYEGFDRVEAYGIEMTGGADYVRQRSNFEKWIGICIGSGMEFYAPPASDIFAARRLYGFEQEPRVNLTHVELWRKSYQEAMDKHEKEIIALASRRNDIVQKLAQSGTNPGQRARLSEEKGQIENTLLGLTAKAAYARGNANMADRLLEEIAKQGEMYLQFGRGDDGQLVAGAVELPKVDVSSGE